MNWLKEQWMKKPQCRQRKFNHIKRVQLYCIAVFGMNLSLSYDLISLQLYFSKMCLSLFKYYIVSFEWYVNVNWLCLVCSLFPILAICCVCQLTMWITNAIEWKELSCDFCDENYCHLSVSIFRSYDSSETMYFLQHIIDYSCCHYFCICSLMSEK